MPNAPSNTLRTLALDDAIEAFGPILSRSEQLSEATVVEVASTKSQDHLLAISRRSSLSTTVTDVLVERGNTAANSGASFSERGFSTLVRHAETEDKLALRVLLRPDVPRQHMLKLFSDTSEAVRSAEPDKAKLFQDLLAQAVKEFRSKTRTRSPEHAAIYSHVMSLSARASSTRRNSRLSPTTANSTPPRLRWR